MQPERPPLPVVTLTLNPAIDQALRIGQIVLGSTNRCLLDALDPGGKGINASRVIYRLGRPTLALGFVGGVTGAMLRSRLDAEGVPHDFDEVSELTRVNIMIYETAVGRRTRIYLPGARVEPAQLDGIWRRLDGLTAGSVVVLGGSLPPGLPPDTYQRMVLGLRERGIRAVVDTSGPALAAVLAAGPALIKPNVEEAAEVLGRVLVGDDDVLEAARELRQRGAERVVISQGADGAIGVGPDGSWKAIPPRVDARSTVGSGDSMVAGMAIALNEEKGLDEALRLGTAAGAATALTPGTQLCRPGDVARLLPLVGVRNHPNV